MKQKELRCECNTKGVLKQEIKDWYDTETELPFVEHKPNECKCKNNLKRYLRNDKVIVLCSCCCLSSDRELK